jgi:outer membrane protein OmpA-like peptidoglycan-associated protein
MNLLRVVGTLSLLALLAGCATTGYVNKRVRALEAADRANGEKIAALETQNASVEQRMQEAMRTAMEAKDEAGRAAALRAAFADYTVIMEKELRFRFDSFQLTDVSKNVLDQIGLKMQMDKGLILEIEGYTDPVGSEKYNLTLGQHRAQSVALYLAGKYQVPSFRMYSLSFGEGNLKTSSETGSGNAANRRVVIRVLGPAPSTSTINP